MSVPAILPIRSSTSIQVGLLQRQCDYPASMAPEELDARSYALRKGLECLEAADDPVKLQAHILEILLDRIPAKRGAVLLNGPRASADPKVFAS